MIDSAVSVAVSFTNVRRWSWAVAHMAAPDVRTTATSRGRCRADLESVLLNPHV
jgi:hypothetical protein